MRLAALRTHMRHRTPVTPFALVRSGLTLTAFCSNAMRSHQFPEVRSGDQETESRLSALLSAGWKFNQIQAEELCGPRSLPARIVSPERLIVDRHVVSGPLKTRCT